MNNFIYAINMSFENVKKVVNEVLKEEQYTEIERNQLFYAIGTCLHWILDYAERIEISEEHRKFIAAFRYVNNGLKHGLNLTEISKKCGGMTFPLHFSLVIPKKEIVWKDNEGSIFEGQKKNYIEFLDGKNVVLTCEKAISILINSKMKV